MSTRDKLAMKIQVLLFGENQFTIDVPKDDFLGGSKVFIGRSDDCHIELDDQQISRHHATIELENDNYKLVKLSTYGTLSLNGTEVGSAPLKEGDKVSVGNYVIVLNDLELNPIDSIPEDDIPEPIIVEEEGTVLFDELAAPVQDKTEIMSDSSDIDDGTQEIQDDQTEQPDEFKSEDSFAAEDTFGSDDDFQSDDNFSSEDEFGEDESFGEVGGFDDDSGDSTQVFQSFANYSLILSGPNVPFDRYQIEAAETFIGRDPEKCQIVLDDYEVSSVHAVIKKTILACKIQDLNSSNGTLKDGQRINTSDLISGDSFQIGDTKFDVVISSELIEAERDILMPVENDQEIEVEEIIEEEVDFDEASAGDSEFGMTESEEKSFIKRIWKDPKKRIRAIILIVLAGVGFLLMDDSPPSKKKVVVKDPKLQAKESATANKKQLSPDTIEKLEQNYALALSKYEAGAYYEAKEYLEIIKAIDPDYKDTSTLLKLVKQGYEELIRIKKEEEAEKERLERQRKVAKLIVKAKDATKKREIVVAENLFGKIMELDPENIDVPQMRLELNAYKAAEEEKKLEAARIKAKRQSMVDALAPGKGLYLKEDWFKAIDKLEKFTRLQGMDEDLIKEATDMIKASQRKLSSIINPLLGKARSFKEGQDLKRAYETYGDILKQDPSHEEALNERDAILQTLTNRSRKLYREALISESLSLFDEAKEKFEQVQQISPVNSDYYNKATQKLENYLE